MQLPKKKSLGITITTHCLKPNQITMYAINKDNVKMETQSANRLCSKVKDRKTNNANRISTIYDPLTREPHEIYPTN